MLRPPLRPWSLVFLLWISVLSSSRIGPAQGATGPLGSPRGLTVVFVNVGQGDGTILVGPTGKVLVFDAGFDGQGTAAMLPALKKLGASRVHEMVVSHYHPDHIGGMDEILKGTTVDRVWDRGTNKAPTYSKYYQAYVRAAGTKRNTLRLGQTFNLGPGVGVRVVCLDGWVLGRKSRAPISGTYQAENAASVVLEVTYGKFKLWLGGDLTGGGNRTYDMESLVAPVVGDVDVYQVDHHGSWTSTSSTLVSRLDPEVCVASAGLKNPYGHPSTTVLNRLNTRAASRLILGTTPGVGWQGFSTAGTMTCRTDGWRYEFEDASGRKIGFFTDEVRGYAPRKGELAISEIQRSSSLAYGEFLEVTSVAPGPLNLNGLTISSGGGTFTLATTYRLLPGESLIFFRHGDPSRNGGLPLGHCWPYKAFSLGDASDTVTLSLGASGVIDRVSYGSGFPGGKNVSAERVDLRASPSPSNWKAAVSSYGPGGKGSPGRQNANDRTIHPLGAGVEVQAVGIPSGPALHLIGAALSRVGKLDIMALSMGSVPGFKVSSVKVPLNPDTLFFSSIQIPGAVGTVPAGGLRGWRIPVPRVPGLQGRTGWFGHFLLDPFGPKPIPEASPSVSFRFP